MLRKEWLIKKLINGLYLVLVGVKTFINNGLWPITVKCKKYDKILTVLNIYYLCICLVLRQYPDVSINMLIVIMIFIEWSEKQCNI